VTARVAVATARYGDPWDELSVLAGRLTGALACRADVDVLVPDGRTSSGWDGAGRVLRFSAASADRRVRSAWRRVAFGPDEHGPDGCRCPTGTPTRRRFPAPVEEQLVLAEGGDSPALYEHLRTTAYDAIVFVGLHSPVTAFGVRALPESRRVFLVPGTHDLSLDLAIHDTALSRAERLLVCTDTERRRMTERLGGDDRDRVQNIGFLLQVNSVAQPESPDDREGRFAVVAGDWRNAAALGRYHAWAERLAGVMPPGVALRLVGAGATGLAHGVPQSDARIDAWWWMARAVAVIDPVPRRVVGQEVLEAMLLGVPVVVAADGDATREYAESGNGGLWYRAEDELVASVARLLDRPVAESLGEQGRAYALGRFVDTDTYVKRVCKTVLG
jgi:glycosyltransferase involved in cell wall biosynthesis